jgi:hypothetical protein
MQEKENSRQKFVENIRQWITLDNQSKELWKNMKEIREKKRKNCEEIHFFANQNGLQKTRIDVSDGTLQFIEKKESSSLSLQYVESSLAKFMNEADVKTIMTYIRENRPSKLVREISRTYTNNKTNKEDKEEDKEENEEIDELR